MIRITFLIIFLFSLLSCKKVPERKSIDIDLLTINGNIPADVPSYDLDYKENYEIEFSYKSDYELDTIYIRYVTNIHERIIGVDENRIQPVPEQGSKKGNFIYVINTEEQSDDPGTSGIPVYEFIKIVLVNKVGTVAVKTVQFNIK